MTHFGPKKCTVSLRERQFATLYLFHAYMEGGRSWLRNARRGQGVSQERSEGEGPGGCLRGIGGGGGG